MCSSGPVGVAVKCVYSPTGASFPLVLLRSPARGSVLRGVIVG